MLATTVFVVLLPTLVICTGEGNIHLLENEVTAALQACGQTYNAKSFLNINQRYRRSNRDDADDFYQYPRIDSKTWTPNQYGHERRNPCDTINQNISNMTENSFGYDNKYGNKNINNTARTNVNNYNNTNNTTKKRVKKSVQFLEKYQSDKCLSQCVFANLHVVDKRGIPREADLWNKIQASVTSQQSRLLLHDQFRACFNELQTDGVENSCSYSNKLERCLMLRFSDRMNESPIK